MRRLLLILALSPLATAYGQVAQLDCERDADRQLGEMWSLTALAGNVTYKKVMDQAIACMSGRQCSKAQAMVELADIMVDEQVIELQRQKVAHMKRFSRQAGPDASACEIVKLLFSLTQELTTLNSRQLARFEALAAERFSPRK